MPHRIEVAYRPDYKDVSGESVCADLNSFFNLAIQEVNVVSVYLVDLSIDEKEVVRVKDELLTDNVIQVSSFNKIETKKFDWLIEIGFKPGVTDNIGTTAKEATEDLLKKTFPHEEKIYSAKQYRILASGMDRETVENVAGDYLGNPLIESIHVSTFDEWDKSAGSIDLPKITGTPSYTVEKINMDLSDGDLAALSKERTLSLSLEEMHAIKSYVSDPAIIAERKKVGLDSLITDAEIEALAQTWSEHCKHKIFNAFIKYRENGKTLEIDGLFSSCIKKSTNEIGTKAPWLLSVFKDNAGVIKFNEKLSLVYKVETHNTPSALEPYGGALTGIVGVNRDPLGTGLGAELLFNVWGYCFGPPSYDKPMPPGLLHPGRVREYVHKGVIDGGNQSGIPYARGWEFFDDRFIGKPLVFCGTVGKMPAEICGKPSHEKTITPGDLIVMAGGRIGKDGIHGATFSSEELHEDSPVQAVQIGDPITQKKLYDFIIEVRDKGLFSFITDNGAGGLSSSIGEMAESSGGCYLDLSDAPLKYEGLNPWEILISEAQERMSLAVPSEKKEELFHIAKERGVELTVLGEFTDSAKFHVVYKGETVAYLDMSFLHEGVPQMRLDAVWDAPQLSEPVFDEPADHGKILLQLLGRLNITSNEGKSRQYDHEVKGLSVIKPFTGVFMDVPSDASVMMIEHGSLEGIVLAEGKNPRYSDIDTYHMTASVIDEAMRRTISAGGSLANISGLDNFCWPDPVQSDKTPDGHYKLAQLVRSNFALYDYTRLFNVPLISGKDSMKNDCIFDGKKISIPPTLLFSVLSKMDDVSKAVTLDLKKAGDLVYVVGNTFDELGGSEYYQVAGENMTGTPFTGAHVPKVDGEKALHLYRAVEKITGKCLASAIHTPSIGGLAVGFAKMVMAGNMGLSLDISKIPSVACDRNDKILYSESNTRFIIAVSPENKTEFEKLLPDIPFALIGKTVQEPELHITDETGKNLILVSAEILRRSWQNTLKDFFHGSS